jgi:hypothetical protein
MRTTDYDRLLGSKPIDYKSARVASGGDSVDDWRGWAPATRKQAVAGPRVVGVAPAAPPSRQDELRSWIRSLERQLRQARDKPTRRRLGQIKQGLELELSQLHRQGRVK